MYFENQLGEKIMSNLNLGDSFDSMEWDNCGLDPALGPGNPFWSPEHKEMLNAPWKYELDIVTFITLGWDNGPSDAKPPKKPEGDIIYLLKHGKFKEGNQKSDSSETDEQFINYLTSKLSSDSVDQTATVKQISSMADLAKMLNQEYKILYGQEADSFKRHVQLGKRLNSAKTKFGDEKRKKTIKNQTWKMWRKQNTKIKGACDRRHREIANLIEKYPKLERLQLPYAEFLLKKNRIKDVFSKNPSIGDQWKILD